MIHSHKHYTEIGNVFGINEDNMLHYLYTLHKNCHGLFGVFVNVTLCYFHTNDHTLYSIIQQNILVVAVEWNYYRKNSVFTCICIFSTTQTFTFSQGILITLNWNNEKHNLCHLLYYRKNFDFLFIETLIQSGNIDRLKLKKW